MALKNYTDSLIISTSINAVAFVGLVYGLKFWDKKILVGYFKSNT
jgi:hypothetical protein